MRRKGEFWFRVPLSDAGTLCPVALSGSALWSPLLVRAAALQGVSWLPFYLRFLEYLSSSRKEQESP